MIKEVDRFEAAKRHYENKDERVAFMVGADWANQQNAAEVAELLDALYRAKSHLKSVVNSCESRGRIPLNFITEQVAEFEKLIKKYEK